MIRSQVPVWHGTLAIFHGYPGYTYDVQNVHYDYLTPDVNAQIRMAILPPSTLLLRWVGLIVHQEIATEFHVPVVLL